MLTKSIKDNYMKQKSELNSELKKAVESDMSGKTNTAVSEFISENKGRIMKFAATDDGMMLDNIIKMLNQEKQEKFDEAVGVIKDKANNYKEKASDLKNRCKKEFTTHKPAILTGAGIIFSLMVLKKILKRR